jgi:hypothetical protein
MESTDFFGENDKKEKFNPRNIIQQRVYEDKLANSALYSNIFIHLAIIITVLVIIFLNVKFLTVYKERSRNPDRFSFSLLDFSLTYQKQKKIMMPYSCLIPGEYKDETDFSQQNIRKESSSHRHTNCTMRADCDQNFAILLREEIGPAFRLHCEHFIKLRRVGIAVRFNLL